MKIVVFKGGLGNQLFQYAFYKYLSRKDETFYFYNDAWYNVSHNGFELDKYFNNGIYSTSGDYFTHIFSKSDFQSNGDVYYNTSKNKTFKESI